MRNYISYFQTGNKIQIKKGDTLAKIAKANNVSIADLVRLNNIADPNKIYAGQSLILSGPAPTIVSPTENDTSTPAFGEGVPVADVYGIVDGAGTPEEKRAALKEIFKGKWTNNPEVLAALQGAGVLDILTPGDQVELSSDLAQAAPAAAPKKLTFKEAFRQARKAGKKVFEWNGKKYNTNLANPQASRNISAVGNSKQVGGFGLGMR